MTKVKVITQETAIELFECLRYVYDGYSDEWGNAVGKRTLNIIAKAEKELSDE